VAVCVWPPRESKEANANGPAHHKGQRGIPHAGDIQKTNDFCRIGHTADNQPDTKQQTRQ
jgi:hypothetical protein